MRVCGSPPAWLLGRHIYGRFFVTGHRLLSAQVMRRANRVGKPCLADLQLVGEGACEQFIQRVVDGKPQRRWCQPPIALVAQRAHNDLHDGADAGPASSRPWHRGRTARLVSVGMRSPPCPFRACRLRSRSASPFGFPEILNLKRLRIDGSTCLMLKPLRLNASSCSNVNSISSPSRMA